MPSTHGVGARSRNSLNLKADIEYHFERLALGLTQIRDAAPILGKLGFVPAEPTIPSGLGSGNSSRYSDVSACTQVEWFNDGPRQLPSYS